MPTYEYACKQCGEHLEVVQAFTDDSLTECPNCKGQLRKVFGSVGVSFKGSGFYKNDSRKAAAASSSSSEKAGSDASASPAPETAKSAPASSDSGSTSTPSSSSSDGGSKSSEKAAS